MEDGTGVNLELVSDLTILSYSSKQCYGSVGRIPGRNPRFISQPRNLFF
jgi:hypothetical protein